MGDLVVLEGALGGRVDGLGRKLWEESFPERPKMRGVGVYL